MMLSLSACDAIDKLTQFEMDYDMTVVIPATVGISLPFNLLTPETETNSEMEFSINDTRKDLVEEIRLTTLTLTVTSPAASDFSFLSSIEVFISADGLSEERVAWNNAVPADAGPVLQLTTTNSDLKEYIKKDRFKLRLHTVTDELLTQDHHIAIHSVFFVDAEVLGQ